MFTNSVLQLSRSCHRLDIFCSYLLPPIPYLRGAQKKMEGQKFYLFHFLVLVIIILLRFVAMLATALCAQELDTWHRMRCSR